MSKKRSVHIARNHREADEWDIRQNLRMTPQERLHVARLLQLQYFGKDCPDIKESQLKPEKS